MLELVRKLNKLKNDENIMWGIMLIIIGTSLLMLSNTLGGTDIKDFISFMMLGMSIPTMLIGIYASIRNLYK